MKKYFFISLIFILGCCITFAGVKHFWRGDTISLTQAEKKWGIAPFDAQKFKTLSSNERAKMAVTIIKNKSLIGKTRAEVRDFLGDHDGFYFTDMFPAYIISEETKPDGETWQMVCLLDKNGKVKDVIIHKNCCEK